MAQTETEPRRDDLGVLPAGAWTEDPEASEITFRTRTMFGLLGVRGSFESHRGDLVVDHEGNASGQLEIDAGSVRTGIEKRDAHLASDDFFDAAGHPRVQFRLNGVQPAPGGGSTLEGELEIREVKIPVRTPLQVEQLDPDRIRLTTEIPVDHRKAGLGWHKPGMVSGTIPVRAVIVLARQSVPQG